MPTDFTGFDVASTETQSPDARDIRNFLNKINPPQDPGQAQSGLNDEGVADTNVRVPEHPDDGSNAWAFAPSRTKSGKAI
jgi:acyl-homoserine lactone acylase PvdQ